VCVCIYIYKIIIHSSLHTNILSKHKPTSILDVINRNYPFPGTNLN